MWPSRLAYAMTLTLNFEGRISILLYLSQKWSNCQETKQSKMKWHIDWTPGPKCSQLFWSWSRYWPWIFKVKVLNSCISRMTRLIDIVGHSWPWLWPMLSILTNEVRWYLFRRNFDHFIRIHVFAEKNIKLSPTYKTGLRFWYSYQTRWESHAWLH